MKAIFTILLICLTGFVSICQAQTKTSSPKKENAKTESGKQMNLIDEQVKVFGSVFSTMEVEDEANPFAGSDNYLELIDKIDLPEETKQIIREQYKVYDLSLDPMKKDSLKLMVDKMLRNAIEKTQNDSKQ